MMLKYNGKAIKDQILGLRGGVPVQDQFEKFLQSLPNDEIFSSDDLIDKSKIGRTMIKERAARMSRFAPYNCLVNRQRFWGSIAAIEQLKKEYNAEN
jgi:hypothetical protein